MKLNVAYDFLPKQPSSHASVVMDYFGLDFETGRHIIADELELPLQEGDVVCFTGASGSGKSSLMQAAAQQLEDVLDIDQLDLGQNILVDSLNLPVQEALQLLSSCGLGEAQLLLRTPRELSDGQRYRFRLALALSRKPQWILADEFTATLDRTLARVIAFNVCRLAQRMNTGFLLAGTHEDILDDLQPSLHVACRLDGNIRINRQTVKKKASALQTNSGSVREPDPTGRTSLGGITEATTSVPSNSSPSSGTETSPSEFAYSASPP